ncbi:hypothetical protein ACFOHW_14380 [Paenibacillus abyssi]|uniref:hypothetical protein n=1 Tax=Paenibacillus abyssi TaxID=1340531 RepID=UPI003623BA1F
MKPIDRAGKFCYNPGKREIINYCPYVVGSEEGTFLSRLRTRLAAMSRSAVQAMRLFGDS